MSATRSEATSQQRKNEKMWQGTNESIELSIRFSVARPGVNMLGELLMALRAKKKLEGARP